MKRKHEAENSQSKQQKTNQDEPHETKDPPTIPTDCIPNILGYLGTEASLNAKIVSKNWLESGYRVPLDLSVNLWDLPNVKEFVMNINKYYVKGSVLDIGVNTVGDISNINYIAENAKVENLFINWNTHHKTYTGPSRYSETIKTLYLSYCDIGTEQEWERISTSNIENLILDAVMISEYGGTELNKIKRLDVIDCTDIFEGDSLSKKIPNLKELRVSLKCEAVKISHFKSLESFTYVNTDEDGLSDESSLQSALSNNKNIKNLTLQFFFPQTLDVIRDYQGLEILSLVEPMNLVSKWYLEPIERLQSLKSMYFVFNGHIMEEYEEEMKNLLPKLNNLENIVFRSTTRGGLNIELFNSLMGSVPKNVKCERRFDAKWEREFFE